MPPICSLGFAVSAVGGFVQSHTRSHHTTHTVAHCTLAVRISLQPPLYTVESLAMPVLGLLNAVAVLACAAVAFRLIRSCFPAFDREVFYYGTYVRARIAYFLDNAVFRHVERVFSGGAGAPRAGDKAVSPKWLTRVLRASGDIDGNTVVTAVTMDKAGLDRGFVGAMTRFNVTYSTDAANAATKTGVPPASLVVKMNANNFQGTFGSILLRTPREAWFYNHMAAAKQAGSASHSGVKLSAFNTPRVYYSYSNFFTGRCV